MYCRNCGESIPDASKFCPNCGQSTAIKDWNLGPDAAPAEDTVTSAGTDPADETRVSGSWDARPTEETYVWNEGAGEGAGVPDDGSEKTVYNASASGKTSGDGDVSGSWDSDGEWEDQTVDLGPAPETKTPESPVFEFKSSGSYTESSKTSEMDPGRIDRSYIPEDKPAGKKSSPLPFIILGAVVVVVIALIAIVLSGNKDSGAADTADTGSGQETRQTEAALETETEEVKAGSADVSGAVSAGFNTFEDPAEIGEWTNCTVTTDYTEDEDGNSQAIYTTLQLRLDSVSRGTDAAEGLDEMLNRSWTEEDLYIDAGAVPVYLTFTVYNNTDEDIDQADIDIFARDTDGYSPDDAWNLLLECGGDDYFSLAAGESYTYSGLITLQEDMTDYYLEVGDNWDERSVIHVSESGTASSGSSDIGSQVTASVEGVEDFVGLWEYDDYYLWYEIAGDGTWKLYNAYGRIYNLTYTFDGTTMDLDDGSGSSYMTLAFEDGVLTDSDGDTLYASALPDGYDYFGVWEYDDYYLWFDIRPDGTYTCYNQEGVYEDYEDCPYQLYDDGILLMDADGEEGIAALYPDEIDRDVLTDNEDDTLFRSELPDGVGEDE